MHPLQFVRPPQDGLEALHRRYKDKGLVVLGFPYDPHIVNVVRAIPGRRFDWDAREWWAPATDDNAGPWAVASPGRTSAGWGASQRELRCPPTMAKTATPDTTKALDHQIEGLRLLSSGGRI